MKTEETKEEMRERWEKLSAGDAKAWINGGSPKEEDFIASATVLYDRFIGGMMLIGVNPTGSVLDFGCGLGRMAPLMLKTFSNYEGVDISNNMIKKARERTY